MKTGLFIVIILFYFFINYSTNNLILPDYNRQLFGGTKLKRGDFFLFLLYFIICSYIVFQVVMLLGSYSNACFENGSSKSESFLKCY